MPSHDHLPLQITSVSTTAPSDLDIPSVLYKYRDSSKANNLTAITGPELFLTCPTDFEDKADCQIKTDLSLLTTRDRIQWVYDSLPSQFPGIERNPQKRLREAQRWALRGPLSNPAHVKKIIEQSNQEFISRMGILSMTADPARLEMWEGYANHFTGFCIGFSDDTFLGLGGGPARYVDTLPVFKGNEDAMFWMVNQTHVKHIRYEFENEYRIRKFWPKGQPSVEQRKIRARPEQVVDVIIGCNAPANVAELCRQFLPHISFRIARPDSNGGVVIT
jgi:hypothetical protein